MFGKPANLTIALVIVVLAGLGVDIFLFHRGDDDPGSIFLIGPLFILVVIIAFAAFRVSEREEQVLAALKESEAKFRDLADTTSDWYWEMDADLRFSYFSERLEEQVGVSPEVLLGKTRHEVVGDRLESPQWVEHLRVLDAHEPFRDFVYPIAQKDGEQIWVRVSGRPIFDDAGTFKGYRGTARNVTVEKLAEQQSERARQRLESVLRATPDAYLVFSIVRSQDGSVADFKLDMVNRSAEEISGLSRQFCIGKLLERQMQDVFDPQLAQLCRQVTGGQISAGVSLIDEERQLWIAGRQSWYRVVVSAIEHGAAVTLSDISGRKDQEQAVANLLTKVRESNAELQSFSYAVSHDLQEPLRMVSSYLKLVERRYKADLSDEAKEFIDYAVDGAERMHHQIQDLLAYSRVTTRGREPEAVDMNSVMENVRANLSIAAEEAEADVLVDDLPTVMADRSQMNALMQNLVGNGIKYRSPERKPEVRVGVEERDGQAVFFVADNGIGIEEKFHERIFQVFQRLHRSDEYSGTGVGLSIAKRIVDRHGGKIWVDSIPDKGTTFFFTIGAVDRTLSPSTNAGEDGLNA